MSALQEMKFMKKIIFPVIAIAFLFIMPGCSTKFNVAAPYKNITVIFAFLDQNDTAHYIRIQKAFLDQNKSAVTMAKEPDSSYYASLNVRVELHDFSGNLVKTIPLNRVDLNLEGYQKSPGVFFTSPNYAYKFTDLLNPNYIYRIKVTNPVTGETDSAEAPVIEDIASTSFPPPFYVYLIDDSNGVRTGLDFAATGINKHIPIHCNYSPVNNFSFEGLSNPAVISQLFIRFNWVDSNIVSHQKAAHSYDYDAGYQSIANNNFDYTIDDISLYTAMATGLGTAPANTQRLIDRSDIIVYLGTQDFSNYQQTSLTQGTGLTGSEIEPIYTNIKGANVLGLFTSRAMKSGKLTITLNTIDSLMLHPLLQNANIKGTAY